MYFWGFLGGIVIGIELGEGGSMGGSGRGSFSLSSLIVEEVLMLEEGRILRGILVINVVLIFFLVKKKVGMVKNFK